MMYLSVFLETFLGCLYTSSEYFPFPCMSVSLLFDSLSFWNYVNIEMSPVLDDISIWNLLDTFPGYFLTISKVFLIYCMSVSLWVNLLPCWNKLNLGTSWVLDELSFWISSRLSWNVCTPNQNISEFLVCLSVC